MFKFLGITYVDFEDSKSHIRTTGFRFNFIDEFDEQDPLKRLGGEVFNCWRTPEQAKEGFDVNGPEDMVLLVPHIGKKVRLFFSRKGDNKVEGWDLRFREAVNFPPDTTTSTDTTTVEKPRKLA